MGRRGRGGTVEEDRCRRRVKGRGDADLRDRGRGGSLPCGGTPMRSTRKGVVRLVRHGHAPKRALQTGIGPIEVRRPACATAAWTTRATHPFHLGGAAGLPAPRQERRGVAALALPKGSRRASRRTHSRSAGSGRAGPVGGHDPSLVSAWQEEHQRWQGRDLLASGTCMSGRTGSTSCGGSSNARQCMLVLIGADAGGKKELLRSTTASARAKSWHELLVRRGTKTASSSIPNSPPAMARSASGRPRGRLPQRQAAAGWVEKTVNVPNYLPKSVQTRPRPTSTPSTRPRAGPTPRRRSIVPCQVRGQVRQGRRPLGQGSRGLLALYDFPPSIGNTPEHEPVRAPSQPCGFGLPRRRAACHARPRSPWSSSSPSRPSATGAIEWFRPPRRHHPRRPLPRRRAVAAAEDEAAA